MKLKLSLEEDELVLEIRGIYKMVTGEDIIEIPYDKIEEVSTSKVNRNELILRLRGIHVPQIFFYGIFVTKLGLTFAFFKDPNKCISLILKDSRYRRVIFEIENKEEVAEKIKKLIIEKTTKATRRNIL